MNLAKLSRRFWAFYFDSLIVSGILSGILLLLRIFNMSISFKSILDGDLSFLPKFYLLYVLIYLIYEVTFLTSGLSSTPGKIILELEVICSNSSFLKVFIRSLVKVIEAFTGLICISGLVAAFNEKKQSFHDLWAGTFVTDAESKSHSFSSKMNSQEFHEEMKRRGIKTFSQQQALAQEMFGKNKKSSNKSLLMSPLLWIIILVISIVIGSIYSSSITSEIKNYLHIQ